MRVAEFPNAAAEVESPPWSGHSLPGSSPKFPTSPPHEPCASPPPGCFFCLEHTFLLLCPAKSYWPFKRQRKHLLFSEASFYPLQPRRSDYTCQCAIPMPLQTSIINLVTRSYSCLVSHPPPGLFPPLITGYRLQRTVIVTFSCLCLNSAWPSFMHSSNLQAAIECSVCPSDSTRHEARGGGRAFSGLHRMAWDEPGEQQPGGGWGRPSSQAKVWGFFFFKDKGNTWKCWSRDLIFQTCFTEGAFW